MRGRTLNNEQFTHHVTSQMYSEECILHVHLSFIESSIWKNMYYDILLIIWILRKIFKYDMVKYINECSYAGIVSLYIKPDHSIS